MLDRLTERIVEFRDERDWRQFHSPKNLAASISIEAAELLEIFQWAKDSELDGIVAERRTEIGAEVERTYTLREWSIYQASQEPD